MDSSGTAGTRTILFTDLVGSTTLRSKLGDIAAEEIRRHHDQVLTDAITAHRGTVTKGLGDGVMAVFEGAADAAACAVEMQQGIDRLRRKRNVGLSIRVGISAGDVAYEDGDWFGTPVVEAARLEAAAHGDQILASDLVRLLAGTRATVSFDSPELLHLKGLSEPLAACVIPWKPHAGAGSLPLPTALGTARNRFVERESELTQLRAARDAVADGGVGCVLVGGEAGIGKTSLVREFCVQEHHAGASVLFGRCDEDLGVPYQPFVEALRYFLEHSSEATMRRTIGRHPAELARLAPEIRTRIPELAQPVPADPETEQYQLFEAVASWLAAASADDVLLLVLDDLHWATKPTLMVLRHVLRSQARGRLLVIGTHRSADLPPAHPLTALLADLRRDGTVPRLELDGLQEAGIAALLTDGRARPLTENDVALARRIRDETAGNAFFVGELVRHLAATGSGELDSLPDSVREVIARRLATLSDGSIETLEAAAVLGTEFTLEILAAMTQQPHVIALGGLEAAIGGQLLEEHAPDHYRFSHALVRTTIYDSLRRSRRMTAHRDAASALTRLAEKNPDPGVLLARAHHLLEAGAVADVDDVIRGVRVAAASAAARFAYDEAMQLYERALVVMDGARTDHAHDRVEFLLGIGEAAWRAGHAERAKSAFDEAFAAASTLNDVGFMTRAALGWASEPEDSVMTENEAALERLTDVANLWSATDDPLRARLIGRLAGTLMDVGRAAEGARAFEEAESMARRTGDDPTVAFVVRGWLRAHVMRPDLLPRRRTLALELIEIGDRSNDLEIGAWGYRWLCVAELGRGDIAAVDAAIDELEQRASRLHQPYQEWAWVVRRAGRCTMSGSLDQAEERWAQAFELAAVHGSTFLLGSTTYLLFLIRFWQGRLAELEDAVRSLLRDEPTSWFVLAITYTEAGRLAEAQALLDAHRHHDTHTEVSGYSGVPLLDGTLIAEVVSAVGDAPMAAELLPELEPMADHFAVLPPGIASVASMHHPVGILASTLGQHDRAEHHLRIAIAKAAAIGAITLEARSKLALARVLAAGEPHRREELAGLLEDVAETAAVYGMTNLSSQARSLQLP